MFFNFKQKNNKGFSLVEMLIYTAIMALFLIIAVNASIIMTGAYARARTARALDANARTALSKISTEIRQSTSVDATSVLSTNPGRLILNQTTAAGTEKVEFYLDNGQLLMRRGVIEYGSITDPDAEITNLTFFKTDHGETESVRLIISITANKGGDTKSETFYYTGVLRGGY